MDSNRNIYKSAGAVIKRRRKAAEPQAMKQETLARAAGLTRTSISNIELGRQKMLLDTFCLIARALDTSPTELLDEVLKKNTASNAGGDSASSANTNDPVEAYLLEKVINKQGGGNANQD
jgi:transcriptional regulator with XRE-family HTH domain